jgi:phage host-nuclease inhibitor protein Gam
MGSAIKSESFVRSTIDETISETHAACLAKLGKSKTLNLITGKRKWAHPPGVDVGSEEPSWLVRYELREGKWTRYLIDENSGVGTQFVVQDMNRDSLQDIVVSNKNGVFMFIQARQ